nr:hypothetical protein [Tanacetum cinerariifolium]
MRSEEELCPTNKRFKPNKSNVRIYPEETQDEPLFDISLEIIKYNTIYNAITLTTEVPKIYMQQFWHTTFKNEKNKKYYIVLDYQRFKLNAEVFCNALQISPRQPNKHFFPSHVKAELVNFIKTSSKEARLEKLKYVAKGEPRGKLTFGMPIPKGQGKGFMRRSDMEVNPPKSKKQNDIVSRRSRTITFANNVFPDPDEAFSMLKSSIWKKLRKEKKNKEVNKYIDSDHEDNENDSEKGNESDRFDNDVESAEFKNDESKKDSDDADDQTAEFVIKPHEKELEQPPKELQIHSPNVTTTLAEDFLKYLNDSNEV